MFIQFNKIETLLVPLGISLLAASIASSKGRKFFYWWIYGLFFSFISLIHAALVKKLPDELTQDIPQSNYKYRLSNIKQHLRLFGIIYVVWILAIGCGSPKYTATDYDTLTPDYNGGSYYVMERKERSFDNIWTFWEHFSGTVITLDESFSFYKKNPETNESRLIYTINTSPYIFRFGGYYGWGATIDSRVFKPYRLKFIGALPNQEGLLCWWQYPKKKDWFINYDSSATEVSNEVAVIRNNSITPIFKLNDYDNFRMLRWCEDEDSFYCEITRVLKKTSQTFTTIKREYFLIDLSGSSRKLDIENKNNAPIEITSDGKYLFVMDKTDIIRLSKNNQDSLKINIPNPTEIIDISISPNGEFISYARFLSRTKYNERKAAFIYDINKMIEISLGEITGGAKWSLQGNYFMFGNVLINARTMEAKNIKPPSGENLAGSFWSCDDSSVVILSKSKEITDYRVFSGLRIENQSRDSRKVLINSEDYYNPKSNLLIRQFRQYQQLLLGDFKGNSENFTTIAFNSITGGYKATEEQKIDFMTINPFGKYIYYGKFLPNTRYIRKLNIIDIDQNKNQELILNRDTLIDWDSIAFY